MFYTANHYRKQNLASAPQHSRLDCQHRHPCPGIRHREHHAKRDARDSPRPSPLAAPSPTKRERRADRGSGMVGVREAEPLPDNITNDKIHYMLAPPSAYASAISTDFVRLLRPIYKPLSFATCAKRLRSGLYYFRTRAGALVPLHHW